MCGLPHFCSNTKQSNTELNPQHRQNDALHSIIHLMHLLNFMLSVMCRFLYNELFRIRFFFLFSFSFRFSSSQFLLCEFVLWLSRSSDYIFKITSFIKHKKDTHHTIRYPVERYRIEMRDSCRPHNAIEDCVFSFSFFRFPFLSFFVSFIFDFEFYFVLFFGVASFCSVVCRCSFSVELIIVMYLTFANS